MITEIFKKVKRELNNTISIACKTRHGAVIHATHQDSQTTPFYDHNYIDEPVTDSELLKLWNHSTVERKYGVYATQPLLKLELESRGYTLLSKHKWVKNNLSDNEILTK